MMKGLKTYGKLMGLMLLACGLLFAGCMGSPSSSEEDAATGQPTVKGNWIPVTKTDEPALYFGDGEQGASALFDGHLVEVVNGATACSGDDPSECWVRIINRDPDYYMANVMVTLSNCATCTTANIKNADLQGGSTVHTVVADGNLGADAALGGGASYCVVEDGVYWYPTPHTAMGCKNYDNYQSTKKPYQILHAGCGSQALKWDFGDQSGNYRFYVTISGLPASAGIPAGQVWWPTQPVGPDQSPNNADDPALPGAEGRTFDFQDRTTLYIMLTELYGADSDKMTAVNKLWYLKGSYIRSNVIAGWGAAGSGVNLDPQRYFGVNLAMEYPDRVENNTDVATFTGALVSNYEYYTRFSYTLRYDPKVVTRVTANGRMRSGMPLATMVYQGAFDVCDAANGHCSGVPINQTYRGYIDPSTNTTFNDAAGYIWTSEPINGVDFNFIAAGGKYSTVYGAILHPAYSNVIPGHMGQKGLVKINQTGPSPLAPSYLFNNSTAVIHDGADDDPEMPLAMFYFKTLAGASGKGSTFYSDQNGSNNLPVVAWTNGTLIPGGKTAASDDDYANWCYPKVDDAGDNWPTCGGGSPDLSKFIIYGSFEQSNPDITQSGQAIPGGGAYQQWMAHVCVN